MKLSERIIFDDANDTATIDGFKVDGCVFSEFTTVTPRWFRIISREDGMITVETKAESMNLKEALKRIEALEQRVKALEPGQPIIHYHYDILPAPVCPPTTIPSPYTPIYPPTYTTGPNVVVY